MRSTLKSRKFLVAVGFVFCMLAVSCSRSKEIDIADANSLELHPGVHWALVHEPYAAFRKEPSFESPVIGNSRRGEVMQVLGSRYITTGTGRNEHTVVWYSFEQGWLDEGLVTIFGNKYKAVTAAKSFAD